MCQIGTLLKFSENLNLFSSVLKLLIVIPARYASSRFPGKPLVKISGKEMLLRVWEIAKHVQDNRDNVDIVAGIDDERIEHFCKKNDISYVMTSKSCPTGTDRTAEVVNILNEDYDFIINLQGDNPLCPPHFIEAMMSCYARNPKDIEVVTPYVTLSWEALDKFRKQKSTKPFSGTTTIVSKNDDAIWFSKQILPTIRDEAILRSELSVSPVKRHIGLYGYTPDALKKIAILKESGYAKLEGLEQLNILEAGIRIKMVEVDYRGLEGMSGVDSPEDVAIAEQILAKHAPTS